MYHILKKQSSLPVDALYMVRYHSFYPWHREGAYEHLTNAEDRRALEAVRAFNPYDLYSKSDEPVNVENVKPYLPVIFTFAPTDGRGNGTSTPQISSL